MLENRERDGSVKHIEVVTKMGFHVLGGSDRSQAATMVLEPGSSTGGPDNAHDASDQWLYVLSGAGVATVSSHEEIPLAAGTLLLIEAGEPHEIRSTGRESLRTLNVYAPKAY